MKAILDDFRRDLADYVRRAPENYVSASMALDMFDEGQRLYDDPIVYVGSANDSLWEELKKPEAVGHLFRTPREWMPEAKSVVSYFAPFSDYVVNGNGMDPVDVGHGWLYARVEGQQFLHNVNHFIEGWFAGRGIRAFSPYASSDFQYVFAAGSSPSVKDKELAYTSNWSERHVAYVCGMGTFGLSKALITPKGVCGRFGSVICDAPLPVNRRPYTGVYDYCIKCGACTRCPGGAITMQGKTNAACSKYVEVLRDKYAPRFGCGKCYVKTPCERGIPTKKY